LFVVVQNNKRCTVQRIEILITRVHLVSWSRKGQNKPQPSHTSLWLTYKNKKKYKRRDKQRSTN